MKFKLFGKNIEIKPGASQGEDLPALISHKQKKLNPVKIAEAIRRAETGEISTLQDLFAEVEIYDPQVFSEYSKRRMSAARRVWNLAPVAGASKTEIEKTAELERMLRRADNFGEMIYDLTDAIGKGFSAIEIDWEDNQSFFYPKKYTYIPQSAFNCKDSTFKLRQKNGTPPEDLWPAKWIVHEFSAFSGKSWQRSLFLPILTIYMYKTYSLKDWSEFLEKFGIPMIIGKYADGAGENIKKALKTAVFGIKHSAAGTLNASSSIDLINPPAGANPTAFRDHVEYWDKQISKILSGGTLTSGDNKTGSFAQATVHETQRNDLMRFDCAELARTINRQLIRPICEINGILPGRYPEIRFDVWNDTESLRLVELVKKADEAGLKVPSEWAHRLTEIPIPSGDEEILNLSNRSATEKSAKLKALFDIVALKKQVKPTDAEKISDVALSGEPDMDFIQRHLAGDERIDIDDLIQKIVEDFPDENTEGIFQASAIGYLTGMDSEKKR